VQADVARAATLLSCDEPAAARALVACRDLIKASLESPGASADEIQALIPDSVDPRLSKLLGKLVSSRLDGWKRAATAQAPSLPRLQSVSWTVTSSSASDGSLRAGVPGVVVQCDVSSQPSKVGEMPGTSSLRFEMGKETLGVFVEGMERIKGQLEALTGSK
jgi:hypothetical protein